MVNDLKRVGLVFTQEGAVDFKKTLQEINIEMNKNYNQFKLTQAQWDNSTKSTEKLRAEQEYLKNAYEIQTDKVNTLKMQLSDLENAENKNVTAIKKKRNELTAAETKLLAYDKRLKEIESDLNNSGKKIEEWGEKVEKQGEKIENAGKKFSKFSALTGSALIASAKTAIDFEDAFAGVEKTVDATDEELEELKQGIRDMAKEIPASTTEISAVAEAAGQLGIKADDVLDFTKVMLELGYSTNISADEAAIAIAQLYNVMGSDIKTVDRFGASLVALGNNAQTSEAKIMDMSTRIAASGKQVGLTEQEVLALATTLASVGLEAEGGGSAISAVMTKIDKDVALNSDTLKTWAEVAGVSVKDFKNLWENDAMTAIQKVVAGMGDASAGGENLNVILDELGITSLRQTDTMKRLSNASELMSDMVNLSNEAWENNSALTNEANKRFGTLKSKISTAINKLKDMAITVGNRLMPTIEKIIDKLGKWADKFSQLSDDQVDMIVKIGLLITAMGPLITMIGKITSTVGGITQKVGKVVEAFQIANGKITSSTSDATNKLAKIFEAAASPVGIAITAIQE